MKTTRLLRVISLLGFLLLMAPFYDSCNGRGMKQADTNADAAVDSTAVVTDSIAIDSIEIVKTEADTITSSVENYETPIWEKAYDIVDDDDSENAFEFSQMSINSIMEFNFREFKKGIKKDGTGGLFFVLKNFCFLLIVITTLLIVVLSFKNNSRIHKFSKLNLILLLITIICLFLEGLFETISQIKWGYYAFIIINLLIFYYSKPNKIKT
jgi:hypothetical protein